MASIRQRGAKWQARVIRTGYPASVRSFDTLAEARRWARSVESEQDRGSFTDPREAARTTLQDIIKRYLKEVAPTMRSCVDDTIRLTALARQPLAKLSMANLTSERVAEFRDQRLMEVASSTVIRELAYLSAIINHARREWAIGIANPVALVRKPVSPPGRNRILIPAERSALLDALQPTGRRSRWMLPLVRLALATAMRRGELLGLRWKDVRLEQRTIFLAITKNGQSRTVPLSTTAVAVLEGLQGLHWDGRRLTHQGLPDRRHGRLCGLREGCPPGRTG